MRTLLFALLITLAGCDADLAAGAGPPADHPILGSWTFVLPETNCTETYTFRPDGTMFVTSGAEVSESDYQISARATAKGYYKWADKITKINGRKDCSGETTAPGTTATNYVRFLPSGDEMVVCQSESLDACFGPLERAQGTSS